MSTRVIDDFTERYANNYTRDYWEKLAKEAEKLCRKTLQGPSVQAIFTHRAKTRDSLKDKLIKQNIKKNYETPEDIFNDIFDLAGVRIALYFPTQREVVVKALREVFDVENETIHPIPGRPSNTAEKDVKSDDTKSDDSKAKDSPPQGVYQAHHLRVRFKREHEPNLEHWLPKHMVEIQIQTVLMHAWAQVEHDITYKTMFSDPSDTEKSALGMINDLLRTGETCLNRLHGAYEKRVREAKKPFKQVFSLRVYLHQSVSLEYIENQEEHPVLLYNFLSATKHDTQDALIPILKELGIKQGHLPCDGRKLDEVIDGYGPFRPADSMRLSFGLMAHILAKVSHVEQIIAQDRSMASSEMVDYAVKCETLLTCIFWLGDLWPAEETRDFYQIIKAAGVPASGAVHNAFKWLLLGPGRGMIMSGKCEPSEGDQRDLDILWNWVHSPQAPRIFDFLLRITKMSDLKRDLDKDLEAMPWPTFDDWSTHQHRQSNLQ